MCQSIYVVVEEELHVRANTCCSLAGVNFCLFLVGTIQTSRILAYQSAQKGSLEGGAKEMEQVVKDDGKRVEQQAETAAKEIKQKA